MHSSHLLLMLLALPAALAVSVTVVTVTAPPAPASTSYTDDAKFENDMLVAHNFYRMEHGVKNLTWNDTSAKVGADYSEACNFVHSGGPTGENLAAGYTNVTASVDAWGIERLKYDFKKPTGFTEATGHFTALVWNETTSVGCGRMNCSGTNDTPGYYVVCEYFPAGNVVGDNNQYFKDNVFAQTEGEPTDTVETGVTGTTTNAASTPSTTTTSSTPKASSGNGIASTGNRFHDERWACGVLMGAVVVGAGLLA